MARGRRYEVGEVRAHLECSSLCDADLDYESHFEEDGTYVEEVGVAYLPHQCEAWSIGGPQEIRAMIADLQTILVRMEPTDGTGRDGV